MYLHLDVDFVINKKENWRKSYEAKMAIGYFCYFKCYVFPQESL